MASISRWMRRMFARPRPRRRGGSRKQDRGRRRRLSPANWRKRQLAIASCSRPDAWRRSLFHGLSQLGLPVVCVESRQAYQALWPLATHKTDRNDARGLAHLACTGFFKPVHVKSLSAPRGPLADHRAQEVGRPAGDSGNQIRGLAIVFGIRPRALTVAFIDSALKASEGIAGLSVAMRGLIAARIAVMTAVCQSASNFAPRSRRPRLTPWFVTDRADGSARRGVAGLGCAAGASADPVRGCYCEVRRGS